jgi:Ca-activated chloride channel family protein
MNRAFEFASPHFLWLLALLAPLGWWALRWRAAASIQFSDLGLFHAVPAGRALSWRRLLPVLRLAALALLIVALARPRFGTTEREVVQEGVDLFYCLDISGSMRAEDFRPNRLEKAKELMTAFASKRPTDRQGIVVFSGVAFMLCPLTFDNNSVQEFLRTVTFDNMQGTAIGMAMARALKKLDKSKAKSKVIIVMTDGRNNMGEITPEQATKIAKSMGVRVYTVGIGSLGASFASLSTPFGIQRQLIEPVDEDLLRQIAKETGGIYRRATRPEELKSFLDEIDRLEKSKIEMKEYRSYDERMAILAWPALALLLIEIILASTRFLKIP